MVSTTSAIAYQEHKLVGKVCRQADDILRFIVKNKRATGWSRSELAEETGIRLSSVCGRVNELIAKGRLLPAPMRKCRITGRKVNPVMPCAR